MPHNQPLTSIKKAIKFLKKHDVVETQRQIAEIMQIDEGVLSRYSNGIELPSKNFLKQFEAQFNLKLADFESDTLTQPIEILNGDINKKSISENASKSIAHDNSPPTSTGHEADGIDYKEKYIRLLEKMVHDKDDATGYVTQESYKELLTRVLALQACFLEMGQKFYGSQEAARQALSTMDATVGQS